MDQLRKILATIHLHLGNLGVTQKLLIGSGLVIMLMSLFLVSQYAGRSEMTSMGLGGNAEDSQRIGEYLQASTWRSGRDYRLTASGDILVRPEIKYKLAAEMAEGGALPTNSEINFGNILEFQTFTMTNGQHRQVELIARQNELARTISEFKGITGARVMISIPAKSGIGARTAKGTASVSVTTLGDQSLAQVTVDAIARLIAGSNSGIDLTDVEVLNASNGRPYRARDPEDHAPADRLAYARAIEADFTRKIMSLYGSIHGLVAIVTADVDVSRARIEEVRALPKGEGSQVFLLREVTKETEDSTRTSSAEPGLNSNTTEDINRGSAGSGQTSTDSESEIENQVVAGQQVTQRTDPGGDWTFLAATIGLPRGWIVNEIKRNAPPPADPDAPVPEPTTQEIQAWFDARAPAMAESIQSHLSYKLGTEDRVDGELQMTILPVDYGARNDEIMGAGSSGWIGTVLSGGGGSGGLVGGGLVDKVVLGALATIAMGMMLMMVRKAGKRVDLPTPEELVGIPPALATDNDIVGEAEESETPLTGIEVDDNEVRNRKMLDQVTELVEEDPETAARLIKRWSGVEN